MRFVLLSDLAAASPIFDLTPQAKPMITLGRQAGNDVALPDVSVSRKHAQIEFTPGSAIVTDLGSSNGTFINDRPLAGATPLRSGDTLRLGNIALRFEAPELGQAPSLEDMKTQAVPAASPYAQPPYVPQPPAQSQPPDIGYDRTPQRDYGYGAAQQSRQYPPQPPAQQASAYAAPPRDYRPAPRDYDAPPPAYDYGAPPKPVAIVKRRGLPIVPILLVFLLLAFLAVAGIFGARAAGIGPFATTPKPAQSLPQVAFTAPTKDQVFFERLSLKYPEVWTAQANPSPNQTIIYAPNAAIPTLNVERAIPSGTTDSRPQAQVSLPDPNATSDTAIGALINGFNKENANSVTTIIPAGAVALAGGTNGTLTEFTYKDARTGNTNHLKMLAARVPNNGPLCLVMLGAEESKWSSFSKDFDAILASIRFV